jgi:hypothetical protein
MTLALIVICAFVALLTLAALAWVAVTTTFGGDDDAEF